MECVSCLFNAEQGSVSSCVGVELVALLFFFGKPYLFFKKKVRARLTFSIFFYYLEEEKFYFDPLGFFFPG